MRQSHGTRFSRRLFERQQPASSAWNNLGGDAGNTGVIAEDTTFTVYDSCTSTDTTVKHAGLQTPSGT